MRLLSQKFLATVAVIITGGILLYAVGDFPAFGDARSPANAGVPGGPPSATVHYLQNTYIDTRVPNVVTAVLADYRGYDTLFETVVILTAGMAIFAILRAVRRETPEVDDSDESDADESDSPEPTELAAEAPVANSSDPGDGSDCTDCDDGRHRIVVGTTCRIVAPIAQLFGFYIIAHGHPSPGGGFQGGVVLATSFILLALSKSLTGGLARLREEVYIKLACVGVFIYAGTGLISLFFRRNFLDYGALQGILRTTGEEMSRSHGIFIVEIGVALTVATVLFAIFANLSSRGELKGGL